MASVPGVEDIEVIGSVAENGPKVVTMPTETARTLRRSSDRFIVAPIRKYRPALRPLTKVRTKNLYSNATGRSSIQIFLKSAETGAPLSGAKVTAVLDPISMAGLTRISGQKGSVTLTFPGASTKVARLYVYPPHGFWGRYAENMTLADQETIKLTQISMKYKDVLGSLYVKRSKNLGRGVRVGVVDSGIDSHTWISKSKVART
jgi:hypothetical protein